MADQADPPHEQNNDEHRSISERNSDPESAIGTPPNEEEEPVQQAAFKKLKARHIQMMALGTLYAKQQSNRLPGAAVGSGLLFQSGRALYFGGPISLFLGYLLMGSVTYAVMASYF